MSSDSSSTNTNSSAGNTYYNINFGEGGAGSSKTPDNNSSSSKDNSSVSPAVAATMFTGTVIAGASTMAKSNPRAAVVVAGMGTTAGAGMYIAGELINAFKAPRGP